mmetsp:Transcript_1599/g.3845  ORF Transcript_1599/g.3845 Transcript_1599/m.3845 type:complete len:381 (-) Transcript_1599:950-2092(-)
MPKELSRLFRHHRHPRTRHDYPPDRGEAENAPEILRSHPRGGAHRRRSAQRVLLRGNRRDPRVHGRTSVFRPPARILPQGLFQRRCLVRLEGRHDGRNQRDDVLPGNPEPVAVRTGLQGLWGPGLGAGRARSHRRLHARRVDGCLRGRGGGGRKCRRRREGGFEANDRCHVSSHRWGAPLSSRRCGWGQRRRRLPDRPGGQLYRQGPVAAVSRQDRPHQRVSRLDRLPLWRPVDRRPRRFPIGGRMRPNDRAGGSLGEGSEYHRRRRRRGVRRRTTPRKRREQRERPRRQRERTTMEDVDDRLVRRRDLQVRPGGPAGTEENRPHYRGDRRVLLRILAIVEIRSRTVLQRTPRRVGRLPRQPVRPRGAENPDLLPVPQRR